jgi:DNA-binding transcriptional ArsR family regulator
VVIWANSPGDPFILGPLRWSYWSAVSRLGTNQLRFAMAAQYWRGFRRGRSVTKGVRIGLADMGALGLNPRSARFALRSLESAGLVCVERGAGRKPVVTLVEHPVSGDRVLYLPIPWAWWYRASPLAACALPVALALWFQFGKERCERFQFVLSDLGSLGCTRFTAGRGLRALEAARLVRVERAPGMAPIVTMLLR